MSDKGFAETPEFQAHIKADWKVAHGIWAQVRQLIPKYVALSPTSISGSMTMDDSWRDLDLSAYVPATVFMVKLLVVGASGGRWILARFRPNGSSDANGESRFEWEALDSTAVNCTYNALAAEVSCSMVDRTLEYKITREGDVTVYLLGYWQTGL